MKQNDTSRNETKEEGYFLVPKSWLQTINETQQKILLLLESGTNQAITNGIGDYIPETEAKKLLGRKTT